MKLPEYKLTKRGRPGNGNSISKEHEAIRMAVGEALMCNDLRYLDMTVYDVTKISRQIIKVFDRRKIEIKLKKEYTKKRKN
jgi:hypothetical protein